MALPSLTSTYTTHWRATETSLARESFNDIVSRKKTDVPAVLQRLSTMSRSAMEPLGRRHFEPMMSLSVGPRVPSKLSSFSAGDLKPDGPGSHRIGTPTFEPRKVSFSLYNQQPLRKSSSLPEIRPLASVRYGYQPPEKGRVYSPFSSLDLRSRGKAVQMSAALEAKVEAVYGKMDLDSNGRLTRAEAAKFFRRFPEISTKAMFDEVDEDGDGVITLDEFKRFWGQVLKNDYKEEDVMAELDDLLEGNAWVNYTDDRDVAVGQRAATWMQQDRRAD